MKTVKDFYYQASGLVLTEYFTYEQLQDDDFCLCDYAWRPLEDWESYELLEYIVAIARDLFEAYELGLKE